MDPKNPNKRNLNNINTIQDNNNNSEWFEKEKNLIAQMSETKTTIASLKLEAKTANDNVDTLKTLLDRERKQFKITEENLLKEKDQLKTSMENELGGSLSRQQELIEKLLEDKKSLSEQCKSLMEQIQIMDKKGGRVVQDMREKFQREMKNAKEQWQASEKSKREKWMADKQKDIRDTTIKGLEPEIDRI